MPQIYIMGAITVSVGVVLWGGLIYLFTGSERRYFWLLCLGLPLSAIANLVVKQRAVIAVGHAAHIQPGLGLAAPVWFIAFKVLITPLVEEAIKVSPLLVGPVRRMLTSQASSLWVGFALGVSFGLGEAAFVAYAVAQRAEYASLPWYAFTGYLNERLFTCFAHGVLTAILVCGINHAGPSILWAYLAAAVLHFILNLPAVLYQFGWVSIELESLGLAILFIALAYVFERLRRAVLSPSTAAERDAVVYFRR